MSESWFYPEAPVTNLFGSHPNHDEAYGPFNPSGDRFVPIDQVADGETVWSDSSENDGESDESEMDDEPATLQAPTVLHLRVETTRDRWRTDSLALPVAETKICVNLKEFSRRFRRWTRGPRHIILTV